MKNKDLKKLFPYLKEKDGFLFLESDDHIVYGITLESTQFSYYLYGFSIPLFSEPMMLHLSYSERIFLGKKNEKKFTDMDFSIINETLSNAKSRSTINGFLDAYKDNERSLDARKRRCIAICLYKLKNVEESLILCSNSVDNDSFSEIKRVDFCDFISAVRLGDNRKADVFIDQWIDMGRSLIMGRVT